MPAPLRPLQSPSVPTALVRVLLLLLFKAAMLGLVASALKGPALLFAQRGLNQHPPQYGPYNGLFLPDGLGLRVPLANEHDTVLLPDTAWSMYCWFKADSMPTGRELVAGVGDVTSEYPRFLALQPGKISLWMGKDNELAGAATITPHTWHWLAAVFDGTTFHLYSDGVAVAAGPLTLGTATAVLQMAPPLLTGEQAEHFGGKIAAFSLLRHALSPDEIKQIGKTPPNEALLSFEEGSKPWPIQTRAQAGYTGPQSPETLPVGRAPLSQPVAIRRAPIGASLAANAAGEWTFADGWTMREAPKLNASGSEIATANFHASDWMRATVPGTVLTTMVDDGVYPDPDYGLNNLAIPETLNKQDYWYRNVFTLPQSMRESLRSAVRHRVHLNLQGINYSAEVWLNGELLGTMKGAFKRGMFDVTPLLKPDGNNVLAVRISPPPHPGIPNEESMLGGAGENGGMMELDGPTFLATEGWDWIPAIRDRDSGIWQPVMLSVTGNLQLGDTQVVTSFKDHDTSQAAVDLSVPVTNLADEPLQAELRATIEDIVVRKSVVLAPGANVVKLSSAEFPALRLQHPRLWWPNGYGKPELYYAKLEVRNGADTSDSKTVRFGVREISYELSLLDPSGHLRRVEFTPAADVGAPKPILDVSHEGMREISSADAGSLHVPESKRSDYMYHTVVSSLAPGAEHSPAVQESQETGPAPYLVIKVNGVRIAARGGNWGMDDARKRVSRAHLEPFFRLNRDANLNMIRNWLGQNTEETFYDLADEYGMLVWNDFWVSTQNYSIEPEDPALFLANARDTIQHFRNHPSIAIWCGRNEGVPQPILNAGLEELARTLDGTRFYSPSSNQVNLQQSGPYSYQQPALYYAELNRGFSVETGTPSMSTLESFQSTVPPQDQWPIDDVWAYHDWHQDGNGAVGSFMAEIETEFGAQTSLADFEQKAQMLNYVDYRAIFEGMNANLWAPNSGRLLWMTQPAWPSTMWQILSSDYDTQASFYGSKKACEPVHVQLNLANGQVDIVNTTTEARKGLTVTAKVYALNATVLSTLEKQAEVAADNLTHVARLDLAPQLAKGMAVIVLELTDAAGKRLSRNLYWLAAKPTGYREMTRLGPMPMQLTGSVARRSDEVVLTLHLSNTGDTVSFANKLTLFGSDGKRVLPAYFSDNYISLLPGETQVVEVSFPSEALKGQPAISLRGWNAVPQTIQVKLDR